MPSDSAQLTRCGWAVSDPLMVAYHDDEWGRPSHDDRHLFEMLILEGFQAGLSWQTILRRREGFKKAFAEWDVAKVAQFGPADVDRLLTDEGIIRHRGKIESAIKSARAFQKVQTEQASFAKYLWDFVGGAPIVNRPSSLSEIPAQTELSQNLSKDLRRRGFNFVGPTICYAFMQAVGLVDDHVQGCFRAG
ncbi:MAG TPA: DNA-3-methyladenine glycosylase I [Capsulimonadaceae bacterium]|nr:DNA-3-methyladenine glycosylase I [Capsulimonadaceae bacterium]